MKSTTGTKAKRPVAKRRLETYTPAREREFDEAEAGVASVLKARAIAVGAGRGARGRK